MDELLSIEFLRERRYGTPLSILLADLDHFKAVNDRWGHPAGDAVLRAVAGILSSSLRATDTGGRYGGEELLVVLPQTDAAAAETVAERWRRAVEETPTRTPAGDEIPVTLSVGIAERGEAMETPADLVAVADEALYRAKQAGRNRIAHPESRESRDPS